VTDSATVNAFKNGLHYLTTSTALIYPSYVTKLIIRLGLWQTRTTRWASSWTNL